MTTHTNAHYMGKGIKVLQSLLKAYTAEVVKDATVELLFMDFDDYGAAAEGAGCALAATTLRSTAEKAKNIIESEDFSTVAKSLKNLKLSLVMVCMVTAISEDLDLEVSPTSLCP